MGKIVTFTNQKGGVGKTTSCVNVACCVALNGYKVLLIDMDPQGNATSSLRGNGDFGKHVKSVYDVLCSTVKTTDKNVILKTEFQNLYIIPSNINLAGAEVELAGLKSGREQLLQNALAPVRDDYDFIFIDCPPSLGLLTINALTASDSVLIPIQCEYFALEGLSQLMNTVKLIKKFLNPSLAVEGVLLTMYTNRSNLTKSVADEIKTYFGDFVYETIIPRNIRIAEAPSYGQPVITYDPKSSGSLAYTLLTEEFLTRNKKAVHYK